jgi:extracellular factor (EF) 3-hydroxypalmitic acid methyl ester biosynthesis protein
MGWSDLLAFRDPAHLEAGIGDYVFRETFRTFMLSAAISRCYAKPRGFPDDYETMAVIYANEPEGDDRLGPLIDRWFLDRPICRSRRAACDRAQTLLLEKAKSWMTKASPAGEPVKVTSLASGAAKELTNLLETPDGASIRASCIDLDSQALLAIARRAAGSGLSGRLTLIQDNAVPTGAEALSLPPQHVIYALGLGEYLSDDQINALLNWAYDVLIPGGSVIMTNLASSNPDRALMEHVLDWKAHHRAAEDLRSLLAQSRFGGQPVDILADETDVTLFACCTKPT